MEFYWIELNWSSFNLNIFIIQNPYILTCVHIHVCAFHSRFFFLSSVPSKQFCWKIYIMYDLKEGILAAVGFRH